MIKVRSIYGGNEYLINPEEIESVRSFMSLSEDMQKVVYDRSEELGKVASNTGSCITVKEYAEASPFSHRSGGGSFMAEDKTSKVIDALGLWYNARGQKNPFITFTVISTEGDFTQQALNMNALTSVNSVENTHFIQEVEEDDELNDTVKAAIKADARTILETLTGQYVVTTSVSQIWERIN